MCLTKSSLLSQTLNESIERPGLGCESLGGGGGNMRLPKSLIVPKVVDEKHVMIWRQDASPTHRTASSISAKSIPVCH
jgi:hypothetical protein